MRGITRPRVRAVSSATTETRIVPPIAVHDALIDAEGGSLTGGWLVEHFAATAAGSLRLTAVPQRTYGGTTGCWRRIRVERGGVR